MSQRRGTTPTTLLPGFNPNPKYALDPTHPSANLPIRAFPYYLCPAFSMQAVHKAALIKDDWQPPPVSEKHRKREDQLDLSLVFKISKKNTHKRTTLRRRLSRKLSAVISLVLTKGADVDSPKAPFRDSKVSSPNRLSSLTFNATTASPPVLADWTYVITPKLEVYRLPYTNLVTYIRKALGQLYFQARNLEETWKDKLSADQPMRPAEHNVTLNDVSPKYSNPSGVTPHVRSVEFNTSERIQPLERDKESGFTESSLMLEQVRPSERSAERGRPRMHGTRMRWEQSLSTTQSEKSRIVSPRRDVPQLVFPSQPLANLSEDSEDPLILLDESGEITSTSGETWLRDSPTSHLGLPARFADLSWRELDNASRITSQRKVSHAEGERRSSSASREALTTPKPNGDVSDEGAVTSSVMSRIFTSKPIFLSDSSKNRGNGKSK
ncbi:hypothetical protein F5J12DRAFT_519477 [Pisolithus orientalis]|uniref:uncharacterized protein n=1 Tax=Pisolithus orientalis TaxID=936130 RepID=UPI0022258A65|nr:uncharacterized protein F5J12DRAFT_519477 [Pisolithus orientalis]KAI6015147.1 hypothetical protein F5J12DRAFT_519477 [Pisolithus orientalis]